MPGLCAGCGKLLLGPLIGIPDVMVCSNKCLARIRPQLTPKKPSRSRRGGR